MRPGLQERTDLGRYKEIGSTNRPWKQQLPVSSSVAWQLVVAKPVAKLSEDAARGQIDPR